MASALYPLGKQSFLSAGINLTSDTVKAALIDLTHYTFSSAHQFWSSASAGAVGTPTQITSPAVTSGVFSGANVTFNSVSGSAVSAIIVYKDTGTASTANLIAYIDGVTVTPNGGNITINWDTGANKIFAL